ncbi:MAG: DUF5666 domain-containing protein [Marinobacter sp.]|uniref:DUF5666 domain-containing protein n=1 Tax=Marinobacter sp. TaxID=50741 RepID=UPI003C39BFC0
MKSIFSIRHLTLAAVPLSAALLAACGGGGGGGGIGVADGGIRGTGSSVGPVSGFGSVFVNGIRFETDGNVASDDGITTESQLDKGMILRIDGEWRSDGSGTAERVEYDDTFRGEIGDLVAVADPDDSTIRESVTITLYGQTIVADKQTVFRRVSLQTLAAGDVVRVSGWRLPNGDYRASYIGAVDAAARDVEIEGSVDGDSGAVEANQFRINGFLVEFDEQNTTFEDGLTPSDLQTPGFRVEAEGEIVTVNDEPAIRATSLERDETRRYERRDGDDIEFAGPVATAYRATDRTFTINGLTVVVPNDDVFDDGLTASDLQPGLLIQVEGDFLADGRVEAEEIDIRDANAEVEGPVDTASIDPQAQSFRVGGVLVRVTPLTIISDDEDDRRIGFDDLNGAFELEVEGIERSDQAGTVFLEAVKIEREPIDDAEFELTGRLTAIDSATITVLGVRIAADNSAFEDGNRALVRDLFSDGERPLLEVEYIESPVGSNNYVADEVELEDEESDDSDD